MAGSAPTTITRRRAIALIAVACSSVTSGAALVREPRFAWHGTALGAPARLTLYGGSQGEAERAATLCLQEIERLEAEFSLYRTDSALSRLNRSGALPRPSGDMLALLRMSRWLGDLSGGAFDVSVQPLWQCYADHFAERPHDSVGPDPGNLAAARRLVDYRRIDISADGIGLGSGMALTLNGIAQGYITDRVADLLRAAGWRNVLVDLGEIRGLGPSADCPPWHVATPGGRLSLRDAAVATSAGSGTVFEPTATHHHLFDPHSGLSARHYESVTVTARSAVLADALSTTLSVLPPARARALLARFPSVHASAVSQSGTRTSLPA